MVKLHIEIIPVSKNENDLNIQVKGDPYLLALCLVQALERENGLLPVIKKAITMFADPIVISNLEYLVAQRIIELRSEHRL